MIAKKIFDENKKNSAALILLPKFCAFIIEGWKYAAQNYYQLQTQMR